MDLSSDEDLEGDDSEEDGSSDDEAGPSRWNAPNSLEMDCVFLEDGDVEDDQLPTFLDIDNIP